MKLGDDMNTRLKEITIESQSVLILLANHMCEKTTGGEFKVLVYIYSCTLASRSYESAISLNTFVSRTGLSKNTVIQSLRSLEEKRFIKKREQSSVNVYQLNDAMLFCADPGKTINTRYIITKRAAEDQKIEPPLSD